MADIHSVRCSSGGRIASRTQSLQWSGFVSSVGPVDPQCRFDSVDRRLPCLSAHTGVCPETTPPNCRGGVSSAAEEHGCSFAIQRTCSWASGHFTGRWSASCAGRPTTPLREGRRRGADPLFVPNRVSPATLVGITAEVCFNSGDVRQVVIERVNRTLALFRGLGPPPSRPCVLPAHYYYGARVAYSDMRQGGEGQARDRITRQGRFARKTET
jgi:hypothetical protein